MDLGLSGLAGDWGMAAMLLLFFVSSVSILPRPALCLLAGSAYGLVAIPLALVGSVLGACVAFWLGIVLERRYGDRFARRWRLLQPIREAVRHGGWRIVLLCRFAPVAPSSVMSFLFGSSSVTFGPFLAATTLGILPGITLQVAVGAGLREGLGGRLSHLQIGLFALGLCAAFAAFMLLGRKLREVLRAQEARPDSLTAPAVPAACPVTRPSREMPL